MMVMPYLPEKTCHSIKTLKTSIFLVSLVAFFAPFYSAQADAWWGSGRRDEDWVLKHGGTIIKYTIKNKEDSDDYKTRMYLMGETGAGGHANNKAKKGDVIETEIGGSGTIDDAINNIYKLIVFKGDDKKTDTMITARPGIEITVEFDLKKDKAKISSRTRVPLNQIQLNSGSEKYIKPSELGYQLKRQTTAKNEQMEIRSKITEQISEEKKLAQEEYLVNLNASIKKTDDELELNEALFNERSQYANEKLEKLEQENGFWYWFWGPGDANIRSLEKSLTSNRNKVMELRQLLRNAPNDELKTKIEMKISEFEKQNEEFEKKVEQKKEDLNFWNRTKKLFQKTPL